MLVFKEFFNFSTMLAFYFEENIGCNNYGNRNITGGPIPGTLEDGLEEKWMKIP